MIAPLCLAVFLACSERAPDPEPPPEPPAEVDPLCADPFVSALADGARRWAREDLTAQDFGTGSPLFDEEWLFGTWMMAAVGLGQHARLCPEAAPQDLPAMEAAIERMLSPAGQAFDARKWGAPLAERPAGARGSMALLGYGGLPLALHRALVPDSRFAAQEQAWTEALAVRFADPQLAGGLLCETYPGERYAVDNSAGIAALALHDRASGEDHAAVLRAALAALQGQRDPASGLLHQSQAPDGSPRDRPRGSGTFLAAWFLHRADPALARDLYERGVQALSGELLGVTAMREYALGVEGRGDVDSGPLIAGFSVSATGFALGGASAFGDEAMRARLLRTVSLGGPLAVRVVPGLSSEEGGATGSHLGDAILLAMLSAEGSP